MSVVASAALAAAGAAVCEPDQPLQHTKWTVTATITGDTVRPAPDHPTAHLVFGDGELVGAISCNSVSGYAAEDATTIAFSNVGTTKAACRDEDVLLEIGVMSVLNGTVSYRIDGDRLELIHPAGRALVLRAG